MIPKAETEIQLDVNGKTPNDDFERSKLELIQIFKNKALAWEKNKLTDEEFLDEIEILFESRLIEIGLLEQGSFQEIEFIVPHWVKKLVGFWFEDLISDQEFINAIEYILESNISNNSSYS